MKDIKGTQTEKNLEAERQNLARVTDIIQEIETRLGPLEKQNEKARIFLGYKEVKKYFISQPASAGTRPNFMRFGSQLQTLEVATVLGSGHNRARFRSQPCLVRITTSRDAVTPLHGFSTCNLFARKVYLTTFSLYFAECQ